MIFLDDGGRIVRERCRLRRELVEFFSDEDLDRWFDSPHRLLAGATPADRIAQGRTHELVAIIDQLKSGGFA